MASFSAGSFRFSCCWAAHGAVGDTPRGDWWSCSPSRNWIDLKRKEKTSEDKGPHHSRGLQHRNAGGARGPDRERASDARRPRGQVLRHEPRPEQALRSDPALPRVSAEFFEPGGGSSISIPGGLNDLFPGVEKDRVLPSRCPITFRCGCRSTPTSRGVKLDEIIRGGKVIRPASARMKGKPQESTCRRRARRVHGLGRACGFFLEEWVWDAMQAGMAWIGKLPGVPLVRSAHRGASSLRPRSSPFSSPGAILLPFKLLAVLADRDRATGCSAWRCSSSPRLSPTAVSSRAHFRAHQAGAADHRLVRAAFHAAFTAWARSPLCVRESRLPAWRAAKSMDRGGARGPCAPGVRSRFRKLSAARPRPSTPVFGPPAVNLRSARIRFQLCPRPPPPLARPPRATPEGRAEALHFARHEKRGERRRADAALRARAMPGPSKRSIVAHRLPLYRFLLRQVGNAATGGGIVPGPVDARRQFPRAL